MHFRTYTSRCLMMNTSHAIHWLQWCVLRVRVYAVITRAKC